MHHHITKFVQGSLNHFKAKKTIEREGEWKTERERDSALVKVKSQSRFSQNAKLNWKLKLNFKQATTGGKEGRKEGRNRRGRVLTNNEIWYALFNALFSSSAPSPCVPLLPLNRPWLVSLVSDVALRLQWNARVATAAATAAAWQVLTLIEQAARGSTGEGEGGGGAVTVINSAVYQSTSH